ncbi:hypothetical protein J6590_098849 [Homalodisca vitripennis]|nr:hypothetical protein J6590_098849 [Homalodisca vitripennis]
MRGKRLLARMIRRVASESPLKTTSTPDLAMITVTSSPSISQEPDAVTRQHQYSGRLQHISYAEAAIDLSVTPQRSSLIYFCMCCWWARSLFITSTRNPQA